MNITQGFVRALGVASAAVDSPHVCIFHAGC